MLETKSQFMCGFLNKVQKNVHMKKHLPISILCSFNRGVKLAILNIFFIIITDILGLP